MGIESPLHLRKRLCSLTKSSTQVRTELGQLKQEADKTLNALILLHEYDGTVLTQLVIFYRLVSPWCDRGAELQQLKRNLSRIDYGQYTKACQALVKLAAREERSPCGVNRTSKGQVPSVHTTFLGERCQLSTETVSYWESVRDDLGSKFALIGRSDSPTIMEVIDARASELLNDGLERWYKLLFDLIQS